MSSIITAAAPISIDGPLPRKPLHDLLSVPGVVVEDLEERWRAGVNVWAYPTATPTLWDACSEGTYRTKGEGTESPTARFESFMLYVPIICSAMALGSDHEEFKARVEAVLEATQSFGVERALTRGVVSLPNRYLGDANLIVLATNVSAGIGLSHLEDAIGQTGRQGMIHLTPAVAAALQAIPTGEEGPEAPIFTVAGTPIAIGGGYIGVDPDSAVGPGATSDWVFATGPVEVRIEEDVTLLPEEIFEALDRTNNDVVYRAEKITVVSWDTALQAAVLVDWSL